MASGQKTYNHTYRIKRKQATRSEKLFDEVVVSDNPKCHSDVSESHSSFSTSKGELSGASEDKSGSRTCELFADPDLKKDPEPSQQQKKAPSVRDLNKPKKDKPTRKCKKPAKKLLTEDEKENDTHFADVEKDDLYVEIHDQPDQRGVTSLASPINSASLYYSPQVTVTSSKHTAESDGLGVKNKVMSSTPLSAVFNRQFNAVPSKTPHQSGLRSVAVEDSCTPAGISCNSSNIIPPTPTSSRRNITKRKKRTIKVVPSPDSLRDRVLCATVKADYSRQNYDINNSSEDLDTHSHNYSLRDRVCRATVQTDYSRQNHDINNSSNDLDTLSPSYWLRKKVHRDTVPTDISRQNHDIGSEDLDTKRPYSLRDRTGRSAVQTYYSRQNHDFSSDVLSCGSPPYCLEASDFSPVHRIPGGDFMLGSPSCERNWGMIASNSNELLPIEEEKSFQEFVQDVAEESVQESAEESAEESVADLSKHLSSFGLNSTSRNNRNSMADTLNTGKPEDTVYELCKQTEPISFMDCIPPSVMDNCVKIGEGVYGEVFTSIVNGQPVALKIIPIEGDEHVNDCPQKKFDEILPEIVIALELSHLASCTRNMSSNFCQVNRVSCVKGKFPEELLDLWDEYADRKTSENDRPDFFTKDQLFIVFEFANGGSALESFKFESQRESLSILRQVVFALAVAEKELNFEHRDLHIGNVLVKRCAEEQVSFVLDGREHTFNTEGVFATVIDFTISRLDKDGCAVFCDISTDDGLFEGSGDIQFDVYRKMKEINGNDWGLFNPYTNILWVSYLRAKLATAIKYESAPRSERHFQQRLRHLEKDIQQHTSCCSLAEAVTLWDIS